MPIMYSLQDFKNEKRLDSPVCLCVRYETPKEHTRNWRRGRATEERGKLQQRNESEHVCGIHLLPGAVLSPYHMGGGLTYVTAP